MNRGYYLGTQLGDAFTDIDFFFSMEALSKMPALLFPQYVPDGNREWVRGEVFRDGDRKCLLQNWGRLDPAKSLEEQSLLKFFRGPQRQIWMREEYCLNGFERIDPNNGKAYRVKSDRVDSSTPPANDPQNWEEVIED